MRFVLVLIGMMFVCDLIWWSLADRILRPLRRAKLWRTLLGIFVGSQLPFFLMIILGRFSGGRTDALVPRTLVMVAFLWHFILLPVAILLVFGDGIAQLAAHVRSRFKKPDPQRDARTDVSTRR